MKLTAVFVKEDIGYSAFIAEIPGANSQEDTLDEACENLQEAASMILEADRILAEERLENIEAIRENFVFTAA